MPTQGVQKPNSDSVDKSPFVFQNLRPRPHVASSIRIWPSGQTSWIVQTGRDSYPPAMTGPPRIPGSRRRKAILLACVLCLALAPVLAVLGGYLSFRWSNAKAVRRLEARARAKGEPLTLAELASKRPSFPDGENAAVPLLKLWEKDEPAFWQAFQRGERKLPLRSAREIDPALPFLGSHALKVPLMREYSEQGTE